LVLAYHAGVPLVIGGFIGVDVFFVISGFLITGLLLREVEDTGRIALANFWARRARRLIPAATVVLTATAVAVWQFGPITQRSVFGGDIVSSALSIVNWRLAQRSVDYLAEDVGVSPVQHFWSLAVEEQFYVIWPLLIAVVALIASRRGLSFRRVAAIALTLVAVPSFVWSLSYTASDPAGAFFVTTTRLWELAVGAILALAASRVARASRAFLGLASIVGIALIAFGAVWISADMPFPGWRAAVPVAGAALVIAGGLGLRQGVVSRALSTSPMVWIGGMSYSLYLWHWPVLIVGREWLGLEGWHWSAALTLGSVVPAWLSYRFVEMPMRSAVRLVSSPSLSLSIGANLALASVIVATFVGTAPIPQIPNSTSDTQTPGVITPSSPEVPLGALALGVDPESAPDATPRDTYASIVPSPSVADKDLPRCGSANGKSDELNPCTIGDPNGTVTVVVVGDSKIQQWGDGLDEAFATLGWNGTVLTKSGCPFSDAKTTSGANSPYPTCETYDVRALTMLEAHPPDLIVTSQRANAGYFGDDPANRSVPDGIKGLVSRWNTVQSWGTDIIVIPDNPSPPAGMQMIECVASELNSMTNCAFNRADAIESSGAPTLLAAAEQVPGVQVVDMTDYVCPGTMCPPVIGGVLVYRQGSHITTTYVLTLSEILSQRLATAYAKIEAGRSK
jgi:peptidoglycan/LPS O-acetylase OafA/YrhL